MASGEAARGRYIPWPKAWAWQVTFQSPMSTPLLSAKHLLCAQHRAGASLSFFIVDTTRDLPPHSAVHFFSHILILSAGRPQREAQHGCCVLPCWCGLAWSGQGGRSERQAWCVNSVLYHWELSELCPSPTMCPRTSHFPFCLSICQRCIGVLLSWFEVRIDTMCESTEHMPTSKWAHTKHQGFSFVCLPLTLMAPEPAYQAQAGRKQDRALLWAEPW